MDEQITVSRGIKLLREEHHECKCEISKLREENENVRDTRRERTSEKIENVRKHVQDLNRKLSYLDNS